MQLRGCQNKQQMLRWLFNDLQQRIECRNGQHMHLIDNIHTHLHLRRRINGIIPKIPNIIHAVVGSCIDFQNIHASAGINGLAGFAAVAGVAIPGIQAVHRLGQYLGAAGLARTAGTGKQICMAHLTGIQLCL